MSKNQISKILCFMTLMSISFQSHALLLLEPYLGYRLASGEQSGGGQAIEQDYNGPAFGARVGLTGLGFMAGVDYMMSLETDLDDTTKVGATTTTYKDAYTRTDLGIFVGYQLPILLRVWGTYYLDSKLEDQDTGTGQKSNSGAELTGAGYGLGIGWTALPLVSLNLQYNMLTYDEFTAADGTKTTYPTSAGLSEVEYSEILFSVSLPIDL